MHSMASGFAFFTIIERRASCAANPESFRDKFFGNGSSPLASRWFGTSAENFSNQKCEICVNTSPLRGMPLGMMTSKAEMRSLATSRKLSPRSKTSRTLPERTFLMPGRSSWRIGALFIARKIKSAGRSSKPKVEKAPNARLEPSHHLSRFAGGTVVTGNVSYSGGSSTAVFTPASPLAYNTVYTATITTGVQNPAGTALAASDTWSFTTATGPAPTVTAVTPGNGSTGLVANTTITATFSEAMNASTITASTFTLTPQGGAPVSATVSYNATTFTATLTPNAPLAANKKYTAAVTTGVVGATGNDIRSEERRVGKEGR